MASRVPDREMVCVLQNAGKERTKHCLVDEAGDRGTDLVSSRESLAGSCAGKSPYESCIPKASVDSNEMDRKRHL